MYLKLFLTEKDIYKYLNISFKLEPNNNEFNVIKYEIYGDNKFSMIGLIESKPEIPDLQIKIKDNNTVFFVKAIHRFSLKHKENEKTYFKFFDIKDKVSNNSSNINIEISETKSDLFSPEIYKKIISNAKNINTEINSDSESNSDSDSDSENTDCEISLTND